MQQESKFLSIHFPKDGRKMNRRGLSLVAILLIAIAAVAFILISLIIYSVIEATSGVEGRDDNETGGGGGNATGGTTICNDGFDNDNDGYIDLADYGCSSATDDSELNNGNTECSDGIDNDGDGLIDQDDPECDSRNDNDESVPGGNGNGNNQGTLDLELLSPGDGVVYGSATGLLLNFTIDDPNSTLDSCWYNIDQESNSTFPNCVAGANNKTFDTSNGNHNIYVYANNSDGDEYEDDHFFIVNLGAPLITLEGPEDGNYSDNNTVQFYYTPIDADLDNCELWGDFTGNYGSNQTDNSPTNNEVNSFTLSLNEGQYLWAISCDDLEGNVSITDNRTLFVDFTNPDLVLIEPSGGIYTEDVIEVIYNVSDANPTSCSVYHSGPDSPTSSGSSCSGIESVNLTGFSSDGDYTIFVDATDIAGNSNSTNVSITIDLPCEFNSAGWNASIAEEGDLVELSVNGGNCNNGETVNFTIYEYVVGGDDILITTIPDVPFAEGIGLDSWIIVSSNGSEVEYYFNSTLNTDASVMIQSGNLLVNPALSPPIEEIEEFKLVLIIIQSVLFILVIILVLYMGRFLRRSREYE